MAAVRHLGFLKVRNRL